MTYLYTPPTWRNVVQLEGSLRCGIPTSTCVYRQSGVWHNVQTAGMDVFDAPFDSVLVAANLATNPSAETDLSNWTANGSILTRDTTRGFDGNASVKLAGNNATGFPFYNHAVTTEAGKICAISYYYRIDSPIHAQLFNPLGIQFRDAGVNELGSVNAARVDGGPMDGSATPGWVRAYWIGTVPSNCTQIWLVSGGGGTPTLATTDIWWVDAIQVQESSTLNSYYDTEEIELFFTRPTQVPDSLVAELTANALTPADPSWTAGTLTPL